MQLFTQHKSKDYFLVRLDPRVKLFSAAALLVMVISCKGLVFPLLVATLCFGLCVGMHVSLRVLAVRFAEPLFIAGMVLFLKFFFSGKVALFTVNVFGMAITGHQDGLMEGLLIASRIFGAVSLVAVLGFATPFTDLLAALSWLRMPRGFIDVALFAWRYLFVLFDDAQVVYNAQKNRLGYVGFRRGLRSFGALAGVLVIKAFDSSQSITTAMVQRGYDGNMPQFRHKPFRTAEVLVSLTVVVAMGMMWHNL